MSNDVSDNEPEQSSGNDSRISSEDEGNIPGEDPLNNISDEEEQQEGSQDSESSNSEEDAAGEQVIESSKFKGQSKGIKIPKNQRTTPAWLTKYERARVIGTRALQISKNSPIYVAPKETTDPIAIAQQELYENKIPFIIRRYLPNGDFEDWELQELERLE